ncbi:MAG: hypothetical protein A2X85_04180 [Geobacteraceae bacterium GWF2_54_21]|nr:MAG: hypothetical protein A2X85_04180 [Geobacteraceae bacterium GWF2_54_21]
MSKKLLLGIFMSALLSGCGSSDGGGTVMFNTVNITASAESAKNPLLADLATWSDETNRCTSATATISNEIVNFNVVSTKSISTGTASNLMLQKATIIFTPGDTLTPALPAQLATTYQDLVGQTVLPGSTLSVPVEVVTHNLKLNFNPCSVVPVYTYNVKVLFDAIEAGTGKSGTIQAGMTVRIADFAD